jgi:hypothetical protein
LDEFGFPLDEAAETRVADWPVKLERMLAVPVFWPFLEGISAAQLLMRPDDDLSKDLKARE